MKSNYIALLIVACLNVVSSISQTFKYTGTYQEFVVPASVSSIEMILNGAQGGGNFIGAKNSAKVSVEEGETLYIFIGSASSCTSTERGCSGGGTAEVRRDMKDPSSRLISGDGVSEVIFTYNNVEEGRGLFALDVANEDISLQPTEAPSGAPTAIPTEFPTVAPSAYLSSAPTVAPSEVTSATPTAPPTVAPTLASGTTAAPSERPSEYPTAAPSNGITTTGPTVAPNVVSTSAPSEVPTEVPTHPTFSPTIAPSVGPTPLPGQPTFAPTVQEIYTFTVTQNLQNIDAVTFNSDPNNAEVFTAAAAAAMPPLTPNDISITSVTDVTTGRRLLRSRRQLQASEVSVLYSVTFNLASTGYNNSEAAYHSFSQKLTDSVASGDFNSLLQSYATYFDAPDMFGVTSDSVSTSQPTQVFVSDDDNSVNGTKNSKLALILGLVLGLGGGLCCIGIAVCLLGGCSKYDDNEVAKRVPSSVVVETHNKPEKPERTPERPPDRIPERLEPRRQISRLYSHDENDDEEESIKKSRPSRKEAENGGISSHSHRRTDRSSEVDNRHPEAVRRTTSRDGSMDLGGIKRSKSKESMDVSAVKRSTSKDSIDTGIKRTRSKDSGGF